MTEQLIADWSMYQSEYHGDPNNFAQLYDPAYWTVSIDFAAALAGLYGVILRVGIGTRKDPCFDRYLAGVKPTGKPWGIYHAYNPNEDGVTQAVKVKLWCPETPPLCVAGDLEMGIAAFGQTNVYLLALDHAYA